MTAALSPRLRAVLEALPLEAGMRVLEVGCGPGALARAIAARLGGDGFVLGLDRSEAAIAQARATSADAAERVGFRRGTVEDFVLEPGEAPYDLAVAIRVGVLDGRHPRRAPAALSAIAAALTPRGRLLIDGGAPLREVPLPRPNKDLRS